MKNIEKQMQKSNIAIIYNKSIPRPFYASLCTIRRIADNVLLISYPIYISKFCHTNPFCHQMLLLLLVLKLLILIQIHLRRLTWTLLLHMLHLRVVSLLRRNAHLKVLLLMRKSLVMLTPSFQILVVIIHLCWQKPAITMWSPHYLRSSI